MVRKYRIIVALSFLLIGFPEFLSAQSYAITNVNVIPMDQDIVLRGKDVLIKDGLIETIIDHSSEKYENYEPIDGSGRYLIPGLSDMHMHFLADDRIPDHFRKDELLIPLKYGVVRARVPIGNPQLLRDKVSIERGELIGPALHVGSPQLAGVNWHPVFSGTIVKNYQQGFDAVKKYKEEGYEFIKVTFGVDDETYNGIVEAGNQFNIPIAGHVPVAVKIRKAIESGQDVDHLDQYMDAILKEDSPTKTGLSAFGLFQKKSWQTMNYVDEAKIEAIVQKTVNSGIWNIPTNHFFVSSFAKKIPEAELKSSSAYDLVSEEVKDQLLEFRNTYWGRAAEIELRKKYIEIRSFIIREIMRRNGRILAGSDSPEWLNLLGTSLHAELFNFVNLVGLSPYQALQTATVNPAKYFGREDFGTIQEGKRADLVLLGNNPLEKIEHIEEVKGLFLNGRWHDEKRLNELYEKGKSVLKTAPLRREYK